RTEARFESDQPREGGRRKIHGRPKGPRRRTRAEAAKTGRRMERMARRGRGRQGNLLVQRRKSLGSNLPRAGQGLPRPASRRRRDGVSKPANSRDQEVKRSTIATPSNWFGSPRPAQRGEGQGVRGVLASLVVVLLLTASTSADEPAFRPRFLAWHQPEPVSLV